VYRWEKIDRQIEMIPFESGFSHGLNANNRWVRLARTIPWEELEARYAKCIGPGKKGKPAFSARIALGSLLIQTVLKTTDQETVAQIRENPYLQYFLGLKAYTMKPILDSSSLARFRKRLRSEDWQALNEALVSAFKKKEEEKETGKKALPIETEREETEEPSSSEQHRGQLILDATCIPSDIAYPTDLDLLNQAREKAEAILDEQYASDTRKGIETGKKLRTYRNNARRDYLRVAKKPKARKKEIRKAIGKQLHYLRRDIQHIETRLEEDRGWPLSPANAKALEVVKAVYAQQKQMYETKRCYCEHRIVSLSQPYIRPIKRGKKSHATEFGAKVAINLTEGYTRIDRLSWENFNESTLLQESVERCKAQSGYYPEAVLVDKLYRNRENIRYCQERGIRISGPRLGRPREETKEEKRVARLDARGRNPVEGKFGEGKRRYSWGLNKGKRQQTSEAMIYLVAIAMNIARFMRRYFFVFFPPIENGKKRPILVHFWRYPPFCPDSFSDTRDFFIKP